MQISTKNNSNFHVNVSYTIHSCGGIITDFSGFLESPKIEQSSKSFECAWLLKAPEGERFNITVINMDLGEDCDSSFLALYNGNLPSAPRIDKYCRDNKPQNSIISQKNEMWIEYRWEKGSTGKEIKLKFEPYGGGMDIISSLF